MTVLHPSHADHHVPPVVVSYFGQFELCSNSRPIDLVCGKPLAVFQYLLAHHDRVVARDALIEAIWPESEAASPSNSLNVAIHTVRQALSKIGAGGNQLPISISGNTSGYRLHTCTEVRLDFEEFERCCHLGRELARVERHADAAVEYTHAVQLYRGDFLALATEEWAVFRREYLKDLFLLAGAELAESLFLSGDYSESIRLCQRLLEHDRCREETYRLLMRCHARLGQPQRVRRWYTLCVDTLRSQLDVAPEPETDETLDQISHRGRTPQWQLAAG